MTYGELKNWWLEAERLGFNSAWLYDHISLRNCVESWTALSALAEVTTSIRFGVMVTCNTFRYPSVLAKMAATVDTISSGRLEFGLGAGDDPIEHEKFGIPCPKTRERLDMLREALIVIKAVWTPPEAFFQGKYYVIKGAVCEPKPVQKPHPPVWIGGVGDKILLRLVAEHANYWNAPQYLHAPAWSNSPEDFAAKMEVLKQHCRKIGRDEREIIKSWQGEAVIGRNETDARRALRQAMERKVQLSSSHPTGYRLSVDEYTAGRIVGTPDQCVEKIHRYMNAGVTYFLTNFSEIESTRLFAENVIPMIKGK